jgi:hypothetical protein
MPHRADQRRSIDEHEATLEELPEDAISALALRVNILLVGDGVVTQRVLDRLCASLVTPRFTWHGGARLTLPHATARCTLLLRDVDTLPRRDQRRLEAWFEQADGATQVISTTTRPLYPIVLSGAFSDRLYYHLNTVLIDLRRSPDHADVRR